VKENTFGSLPPTPLMAGVGLSFVDVQEVAQGVIHLLQTQGDRALSVAKNTLLLIKAVSSRDMLVLFAAVNALSVDVPAIIAAVKLEFGLE
jgi:hypothetical protein